MREDALCEEKTRIIFRTLGILKFTDRFKKKTYPPIILNYLPYTFPRYSRDGASSRFKG